MKSMRTLFAVSLFALTALPTTVWSSPITFWNGFTGPDRPSIEALTKTWSDAHPDSPVSMDIMPWDSLMQKLQASMASGSGPDVVAFNFSYVPRFAESGFIQDLTDSIKAGGPIDPSVWSDALKTVLQYKGRYYAAPLNFATLMMYYNKDIFAKAGIAAPPKTWDEWIADIKKTTRTGSDAQYGLLIPDHDTIPNWPILLWGNGGDIIRDGEPDLTNPKTVDALKLWSDLVVKDKITPTGLAGAEADKLFQSGKAAMEITGPWMTNGFTTAGLNYDVAPVPTGPGGPVTLADAIVLVVSKTAKDPAAALAFVSMWNTQAAQLKFANDTGFPPLRTDLSGSTALTNAWAAKFSTVVPVSRFNLAGQPNFAQIDNDVVTPMIQSVTLGKATAQEATTQANDQLEDLLHH